MSWSLRKEVLLRDLTAIGIPYSDALVALSDLSDDEAQVKADHLAAWKTQNERFDDAERWMESQGGQ